VETVKPPTVLCVDDDGKIVESLALILRKRYHVLTATSGAMALEMLPSLKFLPVVISDMRMPGMDGAAFLAKVKVASPFTVRLLLTGQASMESAIAAVNQGQIFRFLVKPIPPTVLLQVVEAAVNQHRLLLSEKILLEQTLRGAIRVLTELLSLANPLAFGRAIRVQKLAVDIAKQAKVVSNWQIEVASLLSHIGYITLPQATIEKIYYGQPLTEEERKQAEKVSVVSEHLISTIPRLEEIRAILLNQEKHYDGGGFPDNGLAGEGLPLGSRILKICLDFDLLESQGLTQSLAMETLRSREGWYDPHLLSALAEGLGTRDEDFDLKTLPIALLSPGMKFAEELKSSAGVLIVPREHEITLALIDRLHNYGQGVIPDTILVKIPKPKGGADPPMRWSN